VLPLPSATPTAVSQVFYPTATAECTNELRFLQDLTVPDGASVKSGAAIDKRWQVENAGSCNWDDSYRLRLIAGPEMGVSKEQALYPARAGSQALVRIIFTAPDTPGVYRSAWQAYDPQGEAFGDAIYIQIVVP
jgi:hypothetical protein